MERSPARRTTVNGRMASRPLAQCRRYRLTSLARSKSFPPPI